MGLIRTSYDVLWDTINGYINHDGMGSATNIAYTLLFAIFPFLILLVLVASIFGAELAAGQLETQLLSVLPPHVVRTIGPELDKVLQARGSGGLFTLGVIGILITLSGLVETLRWALNQAYRALETRPIVSRRLWGLGFLFATLFALLLIGVLGIAVPLALAVLAPELPRLEQYASAINAFRWVLLLVYVFLLLVAMHRLLPARRPPVTQILPGVALTLLAWAVTGSLFGYYIETLSNLGATYGGLAGFIGLMLFFQIIAMEFTFGAEFNRAIAERVGTGLKGGQVRA